MPREWPVQQERIKKAKQKFKEASELDAKVRINELEIILREVEESNYDDMPLNIKGVKIIIEDRINFYKKRL